MISMQKKKKNKKKKFRKKIKKFHYIPIVYHVASEASLFGF